MGITPFNLKEEMEEGDFDVQGNYHYKKENVIRDNWLDNIDWVYYYYYCVFMHLKKLSFINHIKI